MGRTDEGNVEIWYRPRSCQVGVRSGTFERRRTERESRKGLGMYGGRKHCADLQKRKRYGGKKGLGEQGEKKRGRSINCGLEIGGGNWSACDARGGKKCEKRAEKACIESLPGKHWGKNHEGGKKILRQKTGKERFRRVTNKRTESMWKNSQGHPIFHRDGTTSPRGVEVK